MLKQSCPILPQLTCVSFVLQVEIWFLSVRERFSLVVDFALCFVCLSQNGNGSRYCPGDFVLNLLLVNFQKLCVIMRTQTRGLKDWRRRLAMPKTVPPKLWAAGQFGTRYPAHARVCGRCQDWHVNFGSCPQALIKV